MEPVLAILIGIGLAAACGFRIFVPFLVISVAANSGHLALSPGFEWIGTEVAVSYIFSCNNSGNRGLLCAISR